MKTLTRRSLALLLVFIISLTMTACADTNYTEGSQSGQIETTAPSTELEDSMTSSSSVVSEETTKESKTSNTSTSPSSTTTTTLAPIPPQKSSFSVKFIDVGQADAALIECDGHYMLIDGGNKGDSNLIYSVLKKAGASHLDIVVGTHAHEDHIGGLPGAFNYATADMTLCPVTSHDSEAFRDFKRYADEKGNGIIIPTVGAKYSLGSASITILGVNSGSDINNTSIVLNVQYGTTSFLFTGDAEREAEQIILNSGVDLASTVLKVGHHGSDTGTSYPFLREIMPQYAVISVGKGNSYNHPTDNTLSRLRDADVTIFRTDLNGDIVFTSDGKKVSVSVAKNASTESIMTPGGSITPPSSPTTTKPVITKPSDSAPAMDYIINTNTKKFHYPSCASVKKMKESNKSFYSGSRNDLVKQGYSPCGNCHP